MQTLRIHTDSSQMKMFPLNVPKLVFYTTNKGLADCKKNLFQRCCIQEKFSFYLFRVAYGFFVDNEILSVTKHNFMYLNDKIQMNCIFTIPQRTRSEQETPLKRLGWRKIGKVRYIGLEIRYGN